jgi:hypothetical protein
VIEQPLAHTQPRVLDVPQLQRPLRVRQVARAGAVGGHVAVARAEAVGRVLLLLRPDEKLDDGRVRRDLHLARALAGGLGRERRSAGQIDELLRVRPVHLLVKVERIARLSGGRARADEALLRGGGAGRKREDGEEH